MAVQGVSGVAKDLAKMSSKSAVKLLAPAEQTAALFRWVALLTGSKNAVKGARLPARRRAAGARRLRGRGARHGRGAGADPDRGRGRSCPRACRAAARARSSPRCFSKDRADQLALGRADVPVRRPRRLVRRRHPDLLLLRPVGRHARGPPRRLLPRRHASWRSGSSATAPSRPSRRACCGDRTRACPRRSRLARLLGRASWR